MRALRMLSRSSVHGVNVWTAGARQRTGAPTESVDGELDSFAGDGRSYVRQLEQRRPLNVDERWASQGVRQTHTHCGEPVGCAQEGARLDEGEASSVEDFKHMPEIL